MLPGDLPLSRKLSSSSFRSFTGKTMHIDRMKREIHLIDRDTKPVVVLF